MPSDTIYQSAGLQATKSSPVSDVLDLKLFSTSSIESQSTYLRQYHMSSQSFHFQPQVPEFHWKWCLCLCCGFSAKMAVLRLTKTTYTLVNKWKVCRSYRWWKGWPCSFELESLHSPRGTDRRPHPQRKKFWCYSSNKRTRLAPYLFANIFDNQIRDVGILLEIGTAAKGVFGWPPFSVAGFATVKAAMEMCPAKIKLDT